jgi:hypothetical protein
MLAHGMATPPPLECPLWVISGHHSGDGVGPLCAKTGRLRPTKPLIRVGPVLTNLMKQAPPIF